MSDIWQIIFAVAAIGFFVTAGWANLLVLRLMDERKGKQISALRLLLNPLLLPREGLTVRGQAIHARLRKVWWVSFACWVVLAASIVAR